MPFPPPTPHPPFWPAAFSSPVHWRPPGLPQISNRSPRPLLRSCPSPRRGSRRDKLLAEGLAQLIGPGSPDRVGGAIRRIGQNEPNGSLPPTLRLRISRRG